MCLTFLLNNLYPNSYRGSQFDKARNGNLQRTIALQMTQVARGVRSSPDDLPSCASFRPPLRSERGRRASRMGGNFRGWSPFLPLAPEDARACLLLRWKRAASGEPHPLAASGSRSALGITGRTEGRLRVRFSVAGKTRGERALLAVVSTPDFLGLSQAWARNRYRPMIITSVRNFLLSSYSEWKSFMSNC